MSKLRDSHFEIIEDSGRAISAACSLLQEFQIDDECNDEIPEHIKTGYVRMGLLSCIKMAADYSASSLEWLKENGGES